MTNQDEEPQEGYHEYHLGFFWNDDRDEKPQNVTIDFQLTESMEKEFLFIEDDEGRHIKTDRMRERWLKDKIDVLLEKGFVVDAYGNEFISSVDDLEREIENMNFDAFYH